MQDGVYKLILKYQLYQVLKSFVFNRLLSNPGRVGIVDWQYKYFKNSLISQVRHNLQIILTSLLVDLILFLFSHSSLRNWLL